VALAATIPCLVLVLENDDLFAAAMLDDLSDYVGAVHRGGAHGHVAVPTEHEHREIDLGPDIAVDAVDVNGLVGLDP
jgi:hypothetical protein